MPKIHGDEKSYEHPSYGLVGLSRVSGRAKLFGSSVDHMHYITMTICRAKMERSLNNDHYYPREELFQIALSPMQLGELLTTMNVGHGVPCTIQRMPVGGEYKSIERPPSSIQTTSETYVDEFRQRVANVVAEAESMLKEARDVAEKVSASKTERREVAGKLAKIIQEIKHNLPFVLDQYVEQVERVKTEAKTEIESFRQLTKMSGQTSAQLGHQSMDPQPSCKECAGTGELPSGDGCGCQA